MREDKDKTKESKTRQDKTRQNNHKKTKTAQRHDNDEKI